MFTARPSLLMVLPVCTVVSFLPSLVSLSTVVFTLVFSILSVRTPFFVFQLYTSNVFFCSLSEPVVLVGPLEGSFLAAFALGWVVTNAAGLASYPLDTIRRRMMMTSGAAVKYKSMFDAGSQVRSYNPIRLVLSLIYSRRSSPKKVSDHSSRVPEPTSSVPSLVLVCYHCTTRPRKSCSARSTLVVRLLFSSILSGSHVPSVLLGSG